MTRTRLRSLALALCLLASAASQALANGYINAKNCSQDSMLVCTYDWEDGTVSVARDSSWVSSGDTGKPACRKNWASSDAPGCKVSLADKNTCSGSADIGELYSGNYTMHSTATTFFIQPGFAADCNGGKPNQFTFSGSEVSGCSAPPRVVLHDTPDKSGDSYVLENASLDDMTRYKIGTVFNEDPANVFSLNDRVRAIELSAGRWEICEDINYGGKCLVISGAGSSVRLDQNWSGNWDRKISSIKPTKCE